MFKKIILLWLLSVVSIYAIEEQNIQKVMDSKIRDVLSILKDKTFSQSRKEQKSIQVIDDVFDYAIMAQISLGKRWNSLTKNEKTQFSNAFERKIKYSYLDKLRLYNNQKVTIKALKKSDPTGSLWKPKS